MSEVYMAQWLYDFRGKPATPVVFYPPRSKEEEASPVEFRLADEAIVKVGSFSGSWRKFAYGYLSRHFQQRIEPAFPHHIDNHLSGTPFEVEVVEGIWKCEPRKIIQHVEGLANKVSRRNQQIEGLRNQLATAKQR